MAAAIAGRRRLTGDLASSSGPTAVGNRWPSVTVWRGEPVSTFDKRGTPPGVGRTWFVPVDERTSAAYNETAPPAGSRSLRLRCRVRTRTTVGSMAARRRTGARAHSDGGISGAAGTGSIRPGWHTDCSLCNPPRWRHPSVLAERVTSGYSPPTRGGSGNGGSGEPRPTGTSTRQRYAAQRPPPFTGAGVVARLRRGPRPMVSEHLGQGCRADLGEASKTAPPAHTQGGRLSLAQRRRPPLVSRPPHRRQVGSGGA
jgi:hypothetical protein